MRPFDFTRADDVSAASALAMHGAMLYAGGTNLIDLMKIGVASPTTLADVNALPFAAIERRDDALVLGALARLSDTADNADVRSAVPAIAEALDQTASGQLRNMATLGGNVLQRTRCWYFRDVATACNKREPGSGCSAREGLNEASALLGTSDACIATHASDFAVPLVAFDAVVHVDGPQGARAIPAASFFLQPGRTPERETSLAAGEVIVGIEVPCTPAAAKSTYVKVRDRTSYAFALASCAAGIAVDPDGIVADVRIALGGVATVPWRAHEAEAALRGKPLDPTQFAAAAKAAFASARPTSQNTYKVELGVRAIVRALETVTA